VNAASARLRRWLARARPPRRALVRALSTGLLATVTGVALFVGAVALLVVAADRPGLRAVAGVLIVIELFAFLRSPIRFAERVASHRLGLRAVTEWRRWVVVAVGGWSYERWRRHAAGDLLNRALSDTDELQDLWLRGFLPLVTVIATLALADVTIALLPPVGAFGVDAALIAALEVLGVAALIGRVPRLVQVDRDVRRARAEYQTTLVELSAVAPELLLLGAVDLVEARSLAPVAPLRRAEGRRRRQRWFSSTVAIVVALLGLLVVIARHPSTSPVWTVVATLLTLASYELLNVASDAVDTFVAVSAAAERLEELDGAPPGGRTAWPDDATLHARAVTLREGERTLAADITLVVATRRRVAVTGASGAGKSALLRVLSALDAPAGGVVSVGDQPIAELDEADLRRHLGYVASEPGLLRGLVGDVVAMGRTVTRDVLGDLASVGISAELTTRWQDLSRGERQRVAVVRALAVDPALVVLDEPTSGLGHDETAAVLALLDRAGPGVVVATHDPQVIAWCDVVVELRDGALTALSR
jgi:ABC-type transport system involved in cytochrome bd biosynthesis fused ATPase/permease subunit